VFVAIGAGFCEQERGVTIVLRVFSIMNDVTDTDSSLTNRAYVCLKADLIACRLEPGERLNISKLQRGLGVSQAAVREALSRLTSEGLAVIERNSGFRAAPIAASGYRELAEACATIEVPCLRAAIKYGDFGWEGALLSTYHVASRMLEQAAAGKVELVAYANYREEFHKKLFSACRNQWLLWSWSLLYAQHIRFRQTFLDLAQFERGLDSDYRTFLEVTIARKADAAVQIWCENHEKVTQFIESQLEKTASQAA
jgi:DNA-binding GntR family transcriptional regulator